MRKTGFQSSAGWIRTLHSSSGAAPAYVIDQEIRAGRLYCKWIDPSNGAQDWAVVLAQSAEPGLLREMSNVESETLNLKHIKEGRFDKLTTCVLTFRPGDDLPYIVGFIPPPNNERSGRRSSKSNPGPGSSQGGMPSPTGSGAYHDPFQPVGSADHRIRTINAGASAGSIILMQDNGNASLSASDNLHLQVLRGMKTSNVPSPTDTFATHLYLNYGQDQAGSAYLLYADETIAYLNELVDRVRQMHIVLQAKIAEDYAKAVAADVAAGGGTANQSAVPNYNGVAPAGYPVDSASPTGLQVPAPNDTFNTAGCLKVPFIRVSNVQ